MTRADTCSPGPSTPNLQYVMQVIKNKLLGKTECRSRFFQLITLPPQRAQRYFSRRLSWNTPAVSLFTHSICAAVLHLTEIDPTGEVQTRRSQGFCWAPEHDRRNNSATNKKRTTQRTRPLATREGQRGENWAWWTARVDQRATARSASADHLSKPFVIQTTVTDSHHKTETTISIVQCWGVFIIYRIVHFSFLNIQQEV